MNIVALAGGVGGAKLADGLNRAAAGSLTIIVNTGDDFKWHGLYVAPDLDTVMYTLAGIANADTGWGLVRDTFNSLEMLREYDIERWFQVGDRDLATHVLRSEMLSEGKTLSEVTAFLARKLGIRPMLFPMTNERVATLVDTDEGELLFQDYFVRRRCEPHVRSFRFAGIQSARPVDGMLDALERADTIIICPSNPFVSIEPILSVCGIRETLERTKARRVAVSPIVAGDAIKGPAAKMFREFGTQPSARAVAERYHGLIDTFVIDTADQAQEPAIQTLGIKVRVTDTIMRTLSDRERLAREILNWVIRQPEG